MSQHSAADAWEFTRAITPRAHVRAAARTVAGEITNDYDHEHETVAVAPQSVWAMYLSRDRQRYDYLPFDFDASRGNAAYDAGRLSHWLDELNIDHLICISGPSGGRHVWLALSEPAEAAQVKAIAQLTASLLPSLDIKPLSNPATGCLRPPLSPHRNGGISEPQGPLRTLTERAVDPDHLRQLQDLLHDLGAEIPVPNSAPPRGERLDAAGHPYLEGAKRPLSPRLTMLLDAEPGPDASYTLATVLAGCAQARWRYDDVAELVDHSPAFEHVRTARSRAGGRRTPRSESNRQRVLDGAWKLAVRYVAANPIDRDGTDPDFLPRQAAVVEAVQRAQERADTLPGLWGADRASSAARTRTGTHSTRAVLDALCLYLLQAVAHVVEADVRRLSADTGYGRTTVATALRTLATPLVDGDPESAWIVRVGEPTPPHGQRYRLSQKFSTENSDPNRTQVLARPPASTRSPWMTHLHNALRPLAHDVFTAPASLGRTAGLVYLHLHPDALATVNDVCLATGLDPARARKMLHRLSSHGLALRVDDGWARSFNPTAPDDVAAAIGAAGYLAERRARYEEERGRWAWWSAEVAWMRKRRKKRRGRRHATGVALFPQNDRPDYARYPRGPDGRPDHRQAAALVRAGALLPAQELEAS
ncbi:hypothetical protein [Microbacterium sp. SLBN-111]|uniref:hypothetical protein n=1 Tax=Microbacterium sp. SLBN-111 TaxID=3377733 RepID=UPI003C730DEE